MKEMLETVIGYGGWYDVDKEWEICSGKYNPTEEPPADVLV